MLLLPGLLCLAGCGGTPLPPLAPVAGKVTVDGQPLAAGQVLLIPFEANPATKVPPAAGLIDESGEYHVLTAGHAGAPLGQYKVVVTPLTLPVPGSKGAFKFPFKHQYGNQYQTPLRLDVVADAPPGAYDLKLRR
jgi:hypothetical protein